MRVDPNSTRLRSLLFTQILSNSDDVKQRKVIEEYEEYLEFTDVDELMISRAACCGCTEIPRPLDYPF